MGGRAEGTWSLSAWLLAASVVTVLRVDTAGRIRRGAALLNGTRKARDASFGNILDFRGRA